MAEKIDTEILSKSLDEMASSIKIKDESYEIVRTRKKIIIDFIKEYSKDNYEISIINQFNIGSYKIKTGIKREKGESWPFDIDYVIVFQDEFNYESFKNNLTNWLRKKVKDRYKYNVIVRNKNKVISIAYRDDDNDKTMFFLDIAIYIKKNNQIYHIIKNKINENYESILSDPKNTHQRQLKELSNSQNKKMQFFY